MVSKTDIKEETEPELSCCNQMEVREREIDSDGDTKMSGTEY